MPVESYVIAEIFDKKGLKMEPHVEEAFVLASELAEGVPIDARHALLAAIILRDNSKSEAFANFASIVVNLPTPSRPETKESPIVDISKLAVAGPLASAYFAAEDILKKAKTVWGRDYITAALLALDPSQQTLADEANMTITSIRDGWYRFVTSSTSRRAGQEWDKWWHNLNVPLPSERNPTPTDKAILLTWDPSRSPFSTTRLSAVAARIEHEKVATYVWSVGRPEVSPGDRVFVMRQYDTQEGLVGAGYVVSDTWEAEHWDPSKTTTEFYARIRLDTLQEFPIVAHDVLKDRTGESDLWGRHGSGLPIEPDVAKRLEALWANVRTEPRPRPYVGTDAIPVIGQSDYRPSEHDKLNVASQAEVFATLLIAKDVSPPLALGLLGDWGVGKTFFMRLMQEKITSFAGKNAAAGRDGESESVSRVAQIEFNAWHYVDSDLWASIASRIFDGLANELHIATDSGNVADTRRRLRRRIESSKREREQAEKAISAVTAQRQDAMSELADQQEKRARAAAERDRLRLGRIWSAVMNSTTDQAGTGQGQPPTLDDLRERAEDTAQDLGIPGAIKDVQEAQRVYDSLEELYSRASGLSMALASDFTGNRLWISVPIVVVLLALIVLLPSIMQWIEGLLPGASVETLSDYIAPLLQLTTVVGVTAGWVGRKTKSISTAMNYLEVILEKVRDPQVELDPPDDREKDLEKYIKKLDAEVAKERRRIEVFDRQIMEAQAEIQRINSGGLVYDFLEGRVRDSVYLDRLGLISVIRQDFEQLGRLLRDWRENQPGSDDAQQEQDERQSGDESDPESQPAVTWDARPIERIILYIDDLDRCPPKRVVEVLQAVHLLLAFDLFVVVVAVDARWLERSLNETYNPNNSIGGNVSPNGPHHRFDSHNYLEKIFQIPFTLPVMDETGYSALVTSLMAAPRAQAEEAAKKLLDKAALQRPPEPDDSGGDGQPTPPPTPPADDGQETPGPADQQPQEAEEDERQEIEERINSMLLHEGEEAFIMQLHRLIETPRLAKRFVNTYRLLRVRASMMDDFAGFIDREKGDYRAVLFLLAINVGSTNIAPEVLQTLKLKTGGSFRESVVEMSRTYEEELSRLKTQRATKFSSVAPMSSDERRLQEYIDELHTILASIDDLNKMRDEDTPPYDDNYKTYSKWAREVGLYSFRWAEA